MKTIENYLDDLKTKTGSDNKSAQKLGIDRTALAHMRKRGALSEDNAVKIADLLGIDRAEMLIVSALARTHGEVKSTWEMIARKAGVSMAAGFFAVKISSCLCLSCPVELTSFAYESNINNIHYAKLLVIAIVLSLVFFTSKTRNFE